MSVEPPYKEAWIYHDPAAGHDRVIVAREDWLDGEPFDTLLEWIPGNASFEETVDLFHIVHLRDGTHLDTLPLEDVEEACRKLGTGTPKL